MSRAPKFLLNPDGSINQSYRLCSLPAGRWQAQAFHGGIAASKDTDPWIGLHRPTSYNEAHRQLGATIARSAPRPS